MRINVNLAHNIVDPVQKEQVCKDNLASLEMMY